MAIRTIDTESQYRCGKVGRGIQPPSTPSPTQHIVKNTDNLSGSIKDACFRTFQFDHHERTNGPTKPHKEQRVRHCPQLKSETERNMKQIVKPSFDTSKSTHSVQSLINTDLKMSVSFSEQLSPKDKNLNNSLSNRSPFTFPFQYTFLELCYRKVHLKETCQFSKFTTVDRRMIFFRFTQLGRSKYIHISSIEPFTARKSLVSSL